MSLVRSGSQSHSEPKCSFPLKKQRLKLFLLSELKDLRMYNFYTPVLKAVENLPTRYFYNEGNFNSKPRNPRGHRQTSFSCIKKRSRFYLKQNFSLWRKSFRGTNQKQLPDPGKLNSFGRIVEVILTKGESSPVSLLERRLTGRQSELIR